MKRGTPRSDDLRQREEGREEGGVLTRKDCAREEEEEQQQVAIAASFGCVEKKQEGERDTR